MKLQPPPGATALGNRNITPENYQQHQGEFVPLVEGQIQQPVTPQPLQQAGQPRTLSQQQGTQQRQLDDKQQEEADRARDRAFLRAASAKMGISSKEFQEDLDEARAIRIRDLARHDPIVVPMHQVKDEGNDWLNPLTGKIEREFKREGEDAEAWVNVPFKRYKIDKYSWEEAERHRIKMALLPQAMVEKKIEMDKQWMEYLAYKFFNMTVEDMRRAQWDVLRDYVLSAIFRTNTGFPYYQEASGGSLPGSNPIG